MGCKLDDFVLAMRLCRISPRRPAAVGPVKIVEDEVFSTSSIMGENYKGTRRNWEPLQKGNLTKMHFL